MTAPTATASTTTAPTVRTAIDPTTRRVPRLGGFSGTLLLLELKRLLRNRRTIVFTLVFPTAMFFVFGSGGDGAQPLGGSAAPGSNVSAYILVSMALYGGAVIAASGGASVAVERALGWSRQLRLTPLNPVVYIVVKALTAFVMAALAVTVVNVVGAVAGSPQMPAGTWVACVLTTLACTVTFAALGVFVGYLVPSENVMQVLGPGLALLSFLGGLFIPLSQYAPVIRDIAYWTPMYGVAEVARAPLTHELPWYAVVNAIGWFAVFVAGAAWRMTRDTARV